MIIRFFHLILISLMLTGVRCMMQTTLMLRMILFFQLSPVTIIIIFLTSKKKTVGKSKRNQPWITQSIVNSCLLKNKLHRRFLRNLSAINERNYKTFRNRLTATIRTAKKNFYARKLDLEKNNLKKFWREINGILGKHKNTPLPDDFTSDGENFISHPASVSNSFNSFFTSIGSSLASKIPPTNIHFSDSLHDPNSSSFFLSPTDISEVIRVGREMKSSRSCGFNEISSTVIKYVLCPVIHHRTSYSYFTLSFLSGSVPTCITL